MATRGKLSQGVMSYEIKREDVEAAYMAQCKCDFLPMFESPMLTNQEGQPLCSECLTPWIV